MEEKKEIGGHKSEVVLSSSHFHTHSPTHSTRTLFSRVSHFTDTARFVLILIFKLFFNLFPPFSVIPLLRSLSANHLSFNLGFFDFGFVCNF